MTPFNTNNPADSMEIADQSGLADLIRLALVSGIGPRLRKELLDRFGSATEVFQASGGELSAVSGIGTKLKSAILNARSSLSISTELGLCQREQVQIIRDTDPTYPQILREIYDPPQLLYVKGDIQPQDRAAVAIVGSRHATNYGKQQAEKLAGGLARAGYTIVSGLARGIDVAAQRAALKAGGRTLAFLGNGLATIYPPEHRDIAHEVSQQGALLSEYSMTTDPKPGHFPQRNRLISGVSLGVVVVEAAMRSGALSTARHAAEQGREVFAVPGRVDNAVARGCHQLLREGAKLVESVDDILEEIQPIVERFQPQSKPQERSPAVALLEGREKTVFEAVHQEATSIDAIIAQTELPPPQVLAAISMLELRRLIQRLDGQRVCRR